MGEWFSYAAARSPELLRRTAEHLTMTGVALVAAVAIGVPLGIIASRGRVRRSVVLSGVGVLQTIPSLALLAVLLVLCGRIGTLPAVLALTIYGLLPIVRNTVEGLAGVRKTARAAADALGMTAAQKLWHVELPLALPSIVGGVRTAAVIGVGVATLAAFIGAGGLGDFINRGLALNDVRMILLGAIPAAVLALVVDGTIAAMAWASRPLRVKERGTLRARLRYPALATPLLLVGLAAGATWAQSGGPRGVVIGSKKFSEQFVLGEMMAVLIEERLGLPVDRRFNLGGTLICHEALLEGEIDLYPEYSGTALLAILKEDPPADGAAAWFRVREAYSAMGLQWLPPFGFDNTYVLTVRGDQAAERGWSSLSDLRPAAASLRAGFESEFVGRPDGYRKLKTLGLRFAEVNDMEAGLMYAAVRDGQVDVVAAYATDGRIERYGLTPLEDDLETFPPYEAAAVVREETLLRVPGLEAVLEELSGRLDDATMRRLNAEVDVDGTAARSVARRFLEREGLLE